MITMRRIFSSITAKLILVLSAVYLCATVAFVFFALRTGFEMLGRQAQAKAEGIANICLITVEEVMTHRDHRLLDNFLGLSVRSKAARAVVVVRSDGTVRSPREYDVDVRSLPVRALSQRQDRRDTSLTIEEGGESFLWLIRPVVKKKECQSCHEGDRPLIGHLAVKVSIDDLRPLSREHRSTNILMVAVVFVMLAAGVLGPVIYMVIRPVNTLRGRMMQLIKELQGVERGEAIAISPVPVRRSSDEVSDLAAGFNLLVDRLNEAHRHVRAAHHAEMKEAYRLASVGERASQIVHDVRNPLMGVRGALQVMQSESTMDPKYEPIVEEMIVQLERTSRLLSDLLASARPVDPTFESVDLNEIVQSTLTVVIPLATERNISIVQALDDSLPPVEADGKLVQQLVWNILSNALEAEKDGGAVSVSTAQQASPDGDAGPDPLKRRFAVIHVRDTGKGIPREDLENVFQPFFTSRADGSGLGLTIAKRIVEQHGGTIAIESDLGQGTTVIVTMPVGREGG